MVELLENEARVLKALRDSNGKSTLEQLAKTARLADSAIARAVLTLTNLGLVTEDVARRTELTCTQEGETSVSQGLPERRVIDVFPENGGSMPIDRAVERAGLDPKFVPIVTGWITRKGWGKIEKEDSGLTLVVEKKPGKDDDEEFIERIDHKSLILEELPENLQNAARRLLKRSIIGSRQRNERTIGITQAGLEAIPEKESRGEVSSLTGDMIASGEWERVRLRIYNVSSPVPPVRPGRYHPYARFLRQVKRKLVGLGFREVTGPLVESAFINCDCLFMPQDHPAREIHDLYYLKDPEKTSLEAWGSVVDRVAKTHENGWKTGSTGWRYKYSKEEASKLILRSHGTALSVRTLLSKELLIPGKYFAIARCYRPEFLDRTHLTEFNQAEGIVVGETLNLRNLLGVLEMFAKEVAGADKVRFKPDYFPFTEPSVELQAYKEGYGWLEFGGSGIFRPEVTEPLGVKVPVIAWGLGIDRLYMMSRRIQDIRQIFTSDLDWIREQRVG
jgi:phenylalanyl-tRNA synthetase alpha chain